jgi:hypothetical protein
MITRQRLVICGRWPWVLRFHRARIATIEKSRATVKSPSNLQISRSLVSIKCSKSQSTSRPYGRDDCHNEYYFRFTRGRFVADEQHEMSQRYVRFDLDELARLAAEAVDSKYCISIEKYPDRMYNKVFLLTMDDGAQIVVKILNSNVERPHLTTASEVATMKFVCLVEPFC